ncbi:MAG: hypothetical protein AAGH72_00020 [Verrucomicrobiota bacterium]
MKVFLEFLGSLLIASILGLVLGEIILHAMAGFPNRSGGGSWDLGPVLIPMFAFPVFILFHGIQFFALNLESFKQNRFSYSLAISTIVYASSIYLIALALGYRG